MKKKANLLWVDLEMTGLDPKQDRILEVAAIATDWNFNKIANYQTAIKVNPKILDKRMNGEFWQKNEKVRKALVANSADGKSIKEAEKDLLKIFDQHFGKEIYLAGNSIHQDRKFIESEMSNLNARLHYRMLDVSAWKIVFAGKFEKELKKPECHRAASDIEGSINELKYYLTYIKDDQA